MAKGIEEEKPIAKVASRKAAISKHVALCTRSNDKLCHGSKWILDSGCTDHMCNDWDKFENFVSCTTEIEVAGGSIIISPGHGNVTIEICEDNNGGLITLKDTLYVPELEENLISVTRITSKGFFVQIFDSHTLVKASDKDVLLKENHVSHLFVVQECCENATAMTATMKKLMHRRMGYLHFDALNQITDYGEDDPDVKNSSPCTVCIEGKLKAKSFLKVTTSRSVKPLALIHSDVVGPITPVSVGGCRYYVTFIDDYSHYMEVQPLKSKSDVLRKFGSFL